jgi:cytochrome c biogenesis factor
MVAQVVILAIVSWLWSGILLMLVDAMLDMGFTKKAFGALFEGGL